MIRAVMDWIQANPFWDFVIVIAIPSVFEVSKIKLNPWTWLGKKIGTAINHDVIVRLDEVDKRIDGLEKSQEKAEQERQTDNANSARTRIIRGSDEIRMGTKHSKEFFDNLLDDITFYKNHCLANPTYQNEKAVFAIKAIEETYQKCMNENSFL